MLIEKANCRNVHVLVYVYSAWKILKNVQQTVDSDFFLRGRIKEALILYKTYICIISDFFFAVSIYYFCDQIKQHR